MSKISRLLLVVPPGDYKPDYVVSMIKSQQDKAAVCKAGVFGTIAPRFVPNTEHTGAPVGPGNYEPKKDPSPPRHRGDAAVSQKRRIVSWTSLARPHMQLYSMICNVCKSSRLLLSCFPSKR